MRNTARPGSVRQIDVVSVSPGKTGEVNRAATAPTFATTAASAILRDYTRGSDKSTDATAFAPFNSPLHRLTNPRGDIDGLMVQAPNLVMMDEAMDALDGVHFDIAPPLRTLAGMHPGQSVDRTGAAVDRKNSARRSGTSGR